MPDAAELCIPLDDPWRFEVTVRNNGDVDAGWFSVAGGVAAWRVFGLAAGRSKVLLSEPRFLPESITVDTFDWVEESREDNNTWSLPPGGTPTPLTRSVPYCDPTATGTATRPATPECPGWQPPRLDVSLEPDQVFPLLTVKAHLRGVGLRLAYATIYLDLPGEQQIAHVWGSPSGPWTLVPLMSFPAPYRPGDWAATGYGYGEVARCVQGHVYYSYGGASTTHPITLTVRGSALLMPIAIRRASPADNPTPTSTATSSATPTATLTPTVTATPWPSYFGLDGYVVEGSASGHGVPGVVIALWVDGAAQSPVHTDADGFYSTPILELQAADWVAIPRKQGFTFEPATVTGRHEGRPGEHVQRVSFMAFRGTPTARMR